MAKRIKIRKKWKKTEQRTNNHWNGYSTDNKGSWLEVSRTGWSQGYWLKNFLALHERIERQMNDMIKSRMDIPKWMVTGKTILCQKDPGKGNAVDNYQPILCLPFMWKLMIRIIANSVYEYLQVYKLIPVEQKGCRRNIRGTEDQLVIDKMVLNDCKKRHTNLGMIWIIRKLMIWFPIPEFWKVLN